MSKAADKSRKVIAATLSFSIFSKTSFSTFKSADSVEWNLLYADCKLLDIELIPCGKVGEMRPLSPISLI